MIKYTKDGWTIHHYLDNESFKALEPSRHNLDVFHRTITARNTIPADEFKQWYGAVSFDQLDDFVYNGWQKGVLKAKNIIGNFEVPRLPSIKKKKRMSSLRGSLMPSRVYSGSAKPFKQSHREQGNRMGYRGRITLVIEFGGNSHCDHDDLFWNGATGLILAEALIKTGRAVRIIGCASSCLEFLDDRPDEYRCVVRELKKYNQAFDISKLFSVTALSGFYRSFVFRDYLSTNRPICQSLGRHVKTELSVLDRLVHNDDVIHISYVRSRHECRQQLERLAERIRDGVKC